jgi:hypothetical protein
MIPTKEKIEEIACLEQRSHDWFRARLGCVTGSCAYSVTKQSDAEKAYRKAIEVGPATIETKTDFNKRLKLIKDPGLYANAVAEGQLKESNEEFDLRIAQLQLKAEEAPFPDTTVGYLYQLAAERNLRDVFVQDEELFNQYLMRTTFSSNAIRWGEETENMARLQYSRKTGNEVAEVGFHRHSKVDWFGDSPDGLVVDKESGLPIGAIEIKCPKSDTWIRYRHEFRKAERLYNKFVEQYMTIHPEVDSDAFTEDMLPCEQRLDTLNAETLKRIKPEYYWQCQSHCECNEVDWCDFIFYDQMQKGEMVIIRIYRNQEDIDYLLSRIERANDFIENDILA